MAKRKQSKPQKQGSGEQSSEEQQLPTLGEMLRPAIQEMVKDLLTRSGIATQAKFAHGAPFDANELSRYKHGKAVPLKHLMALGERAGLTEGQTAWLLGKHLMKVNEHHRLVQESKQPDEIREPESIYDDQNMSRELDAVLALDFRPLEPSRLMQRNLERKRLREICEEVQTSVERQAGMVIEWLRWFRESCEDELRQAAGNRYPRR